MNKKSVGFSLIVIVAVPAPSLAQQMTAARQQQAQNHADQQARNAAMTQAALAQQSQQSQQPVRRNS